MFNHGDLAIFKTLFMLDRLIIEFDKGLRTLFATPSSQRPHPGQSIPEALNEKSDKQHATALLRSSHSEAIRIQALYSGQAITARSPEITAALRTAAREETEHLAWSEKRIKDLGGRTSLLNPVLYSSAFGVGLLTGSFGNRWNLGWIVETERQLSNHLAHQLERLPANDQKSRAILSQIQADEAFHEQHATALGADELPFPVKTSMRILSKIMTTTTYHL